MADKSDKSSKQPSWIHRIPVWKEFGPWLKWASALATGATIAVGFGEYALGLILLTLCLACCIAQIWVWQTDRHRALKALLMIFAVALVSYGVIVTIDQRGDKPWGVLWKKKDRSQSFSVVVEQVFGERHSREDVNGHIVLVVGDRCFSAHLGMFISLVSTQRPAMIRTFYVEGQNSRKEWVKLTKPFMPWWGLNEWYWTGLGLGRAMKWNSQSLDYLIFDKTILAHTPVRGWLFFEVPEDVKIEPGSPVRFHIEDYEGAETTLVVVVGTSQSDEAQGVPYFLSSGHDLTRCRLERFSEVAK